MVDQRARGKGRWAVPAMGLLLQLCLGTVYAWSYFQKPIMAAYGWTTSQVMWIFSIAITFLGLSAAWAGTRIGSIGPRRLAMCGGILYGLGWALGSLAMTLHSLPLFYAGFGAIGGMGLGLGYVTPVATAARWFPERKGLITGLVVMGFGLGALGMSKFVAPLLLRWASGSLPAVFLYTGIGLGILAASAGMFMRNPPGIALEPAASAGPRAVKSLLSRDFFGLWLTFLANITAGMMFIGMQSPMLQELLARRDSSASAEALAAAGATLVAVSSLFNGIGRLAWGAVSDRIGRMPTFRVLLITQVAAFAALAFLKQPLVFGVLVCWVLSCYGGGFGTMPSAVNATFGPALMPVAYGFMLTAWSLGGIAGPQLAAGIRDRFPENWQAYTFLCGMSILAAGAAASFLVRGKGSRPEGERG